MNSSTKTAFDALCAPLALPVVCAPMFLASGPDLVVGACESGVVGAFPTMNCRTAEDLDRWMADITTRLAAARQAGRTVVPWAANLVMHTTNARLPRDLELVSKYQPPLVITALGSPRAAVEPVHAYGGLVFADVITPSFAKKALDSGADGLVLVCAGAGGHFGPIAAPAFVAEVREFFDGPLIVAGAVANGRAIRAYQALGADLVYMGTSFIAASESIAPAGHKQMLVDSRGEDIHPTNAITGAWANFLRPSLVASGLDPATLRPKGGVDASDPQNEAKPWKTLWSAGQAVAQVKAVEPVAEIVARLKREYVEAVRREAADPWAAKFRGA